MISENDQKQSIFNEFMDFKHPTSFHENQHNYALSVCYRKTLVTAIRTGESKHLELFVIKIFSKQIYINIIAFVYHFHQYLICQKFSLSYQGFKFFLKEVF